MTSNTGFKTTNRKQVKATLSPVSTLNAKNVKIDDKCKTYTSANGKFVPVNLNVDGKRRPLTFQARGVLVSFAGTSAKKENMNKPIDQRPYSFLINAVKDECKYVSGNKGEGPALYKFINELEDRIEEMVRTENTEVAATSPERFPVANAWGCIGSKMEDVVSTKKDGKGKTKVKTYIAPELIRLAQVGAPKKDKDTGEDTDEYWDDSVGFKLRLTKDHGKFETLFVDEHGDDMNVTPDNIGSKIPRNSFAILTLELNRLWVTDGKLKIIANMKKAMIVTPERIIEEADGFDNIEPKSEENSSSEAEETVVSKPTGKSASKPAAKPVVTPAVDDADPDGSTAELDQLVSDEDGDSDV